VRKATDTIDLHETALALGEAATPIRDWLQEQHPGQHVHPGTHLEADLGVDSMEWLHLALEIRRRWGIDLDGAAISRIRSVGDLLREVTAGPRLTAAACLATPLDEPETFLGERGRYWLDPLSATELAMARCLYVWNWLQIRAAFRVQVHGLCHLPAGPFVLAPHHTSYLDSFVLAATLSFNLLRRTYWAAWTGVAFGAGFRMLRRRTHVLPVDSSWGGASSLAFGAAVLRRRGNLVWFPEGKLSTSGELLDLQPGIGLLLARYPVPIIPVLLQGTSEALPTGRWLPRPGPIDVVFGRPIDTRGLVMRNARQAPDRIVSVLHEELARLQEPSSTLSTN
jgi:long-chain acyl-CoA synthetase